jgi:DNA polymerase-1
MDASAPLPPLRAQKPTWSRAAQLAREWDLNRLADRLSSLEDATDGSDRVSTRSH